MALPHQKQSLPHLSKISALLLLILLQSCKHEKQVYKSNCNDDKSFKQVSFTHLMDSLDKYDQQYVEISGTYEEDKGLSALFNDTSLMERSIKNNALWVDFSQECPLYLEGTRKGLFEYNDGQFTQINNRSVTIRGFVDLHNKGHLKQYRGTIERISLVKL